jgi:uncharacterized membrane protein
MRRRRVGASKAGGGASRRVYHSTVIVLRRAFVVTAIAWAIALPLAPWIASRPHLTAVLSAMTIAIYGIGGVVCHQRPERSFHLWAAQLPVCARCTGIYAGAAICALVGVGRAFQAGEGRSAALWHAQGIPSLSRNESLAPRRAVVAAAAIPSIATLIYEWTTGDVPSNWIRFAAGLPIGIVVAALVVRPFDHDHGRPEPVEGRVN